MIIRKLMIFTGFTLIATLAAMADITYVDLTEAPETVSLSAFDGSSMEHRYSITEERLVENTGSMNLSLLAETDKKGRFHFAEISLGNGFALVSELDSISNLLDFNGGQVVAENQRNSTSVYDGYIAFSFDQGDGNFFYGWAEVVATAMVNANGKSSNADFSIKRFAYNNNVNEAISAGQFDQVIPEPATVTMILGAGIGLIAVRRIFVRQDAS